MRTRDQKIADMRDLLNYLETHPDVPMPALHTLHAFADPVEMRVIALSMGGAEKATSGEWFYLWREFGGIRLTINFARDEVCEKKKVGTKLIAAKAAEPAREIDVYEWDCPPSILEGSR